MRNLAARAVLLLAAASALNAPLAAQESDKGRPAAIPAAAVEPDIRDFKANYTPVEYLPFHGLAWEYADLGVLLLLLGSGAWIVLKRASARWLILQISLSLLYLGFWRGGCICPVGAVACVSRALLYPEQIGRITLMLFLAPLAMALVAGRVFCGTVCPLGAVQHLLFRRSRPAALPSWLDRPLMAVPVVVLLSTAWIATRGASSLICRLDPFVTAFLFGEASIRKLLSGWGLVFAEPGFPRVGDAAAWAFFGGALVLSVVVAFPFCRYVCPFGVLLGLFSLFAPKRRTLDRARCGNCRSCQRSCPTRAISADRKTGLPNLNAYKCIQCGRCSEVCKRQAV